MAGPPPPPPPPPPSMSGAVQPPLPPVTSDRNALLNDIHKGKKLKKAVTNDRSAPAVAGSASDAAPVSSNNRSSNSAFSAPAVPQLGDIFASGVPKLKHINHLSTTSTNNAPKSIPSLPSVPLGRPSAKSKAPISSKAPALPSMGAPPLPTGAPPIPSSAPPIPSSAPKLPFSHPNKVSIGTKPQMPSRRPTAKTTTSSAPPLPSQAPPIPVGAPAPSLLPPSGVPPAPPLPSTGAPAPPPLPSTGAPTAPPLPPSGAPPAPSLPSMAAPPAPPLPAVGVPSTTAAPPTPQTKQNANSAPTPAGGLPFLAEINQRRNENYVVDDSTVKAKTNQNSSAPKGQESIQASLSKPNEPTISSTGGNPLLEEMVKRSQSSNKAANGLPREEPRHQVPPLPPSGAPPAPSLPSTVAPPLPSSGAPPAPPLPSTGAPVPPPLPSTGVPTAPPLPPSGAPPAPSLPSMAAPPPPPLPPSGAPPAPSLPSMAAPPAPPLPAVGVPSTTAVPPTPQTKQNANSAPTPAGGLPFLAEINQRRNENYVVDDNTIKTTGNENSSAPVKRDTIPASLPNMTSAPLAHPVGNPLIDEMMKRSHPSEFNTSSSSSTKPAVPSVPAPAVVAPPLSNMNFPSSSPKPAAPAPPPPTQAPPIMHNDVSDTSSLFSESTSLSTSRHRKAPPPPPPPPANSTPTLSISNNSNSRPSMEMVSPTLSTTPHIIDTENKGLIGTFKNRFGHHKKPNFGYGTKSTAEETEKILETQAVGDELRKIDASAYTIAKPNISAKSGSGNGIGTYVKMTSPKYRFVNSNDLPKPHKFSNKTKLYPSGRGSSVPLDPTRL